MRHQAKAEFVDKETFRPGGDSLSREEVHLRVTTKGSYSMIPSQGLL